MTNPYGQQQGYAQAAPAAAPPNYLVWSIISIFLFWPLAIAAIIKSTSVDKLWAQGQHDQARQASKTAKTLNIVALVLAVVVIIIAVILSIVAVSAVSDLGDLPNLPK